MGRKTRSPKASAHPRKSKRTSSVRTRAFELVTLTPRTRAFSTIAMRFREETPWAISAAKEPLCMRRSSTSLGLLTRKRL